jgi:hypothetical protein
MSLSLQEFLASATIQAATDLEQALLQLPEDKRNWKSSQQSRSALDQVAECAIMNERVVDMIRLGVFPANYAHIEYQQQIGGLCSDWPTLQKLLHVNAAKVADVIRSVPDEDLEAQSDSMNYPYWNMTYHIGQINYIASMLDCLD